ncbi:MAG: hypothetical protein H7124_03725 [Phycisphaerales bacterium]|nr:hypothetical protein [Hyphomonadaceae bacterium]
MSDQRLARFIVWLMAVLAWCAIGCPRQTRADWRHHQRYGRITHTRLTHAVRNIVIIRAAALAPEPAAAKRTHQPRFCPAGFRRARIRARGSCLRAWGGVWLRRQLKVRGSLLDQALRLIAARSRASKRL